MSEGYSEAGSPPGPAAGGPGAGVIGRSTQAVMQRGRGLFLPFAFAWLIAIAMLVQLIRQGGFWQVAANTRVLDFLANAGLVRVTDTDIGSFFGGLQDAKFYVQSRDVVDWLVVVLAIFVMMGVWWLKASQFHNLARFCRVRGNHSEGTFGQHARAYFYGHGIGRLFPYNMGSVASAAALEGQGMPLAGASQVVYVGSLLLVFETGVFALYGLLALGYTKWLAEIAWPLAVLGLALLVTKAGRDGTGISLRQHARYSKQAIRALASDRVLLVKLAAMSVIAFLGVEFSVYLVTQAFTTTFVILNVSFNVIVMAVVGGYTARLIQVTPGGLGQWEWGFALPLYVNGMGMPEAVSIALLMTALRYFTGGVMFAAMMVTKGVETDLPRVFAIFKSPEPAPDSGAV